MVYFPHDCVCTSVSVSQLNKRQASTLIDDLRFLYLAFSHRNLDFNLHSHISIASTPHQHHINFTMFDPSTPPPDSSCPFCTISSTYQPYDPLDPPPPSSPSLDPDLVSPSSFVVLSTPVLVAFLDILPLSPGHLLLCPRPHRPKLSDVSSDEAAQLGEYLRILSKAMTHATGIEDWNVVQNNGAAAAQVVPHMHYHIIPRPEIRASGRFSESFTMFGRGKREELDDDEAVLLADKFRQSIATVLKEEEEKKSVAKL